MDARDPSIDALLAQERARFASTLPAKVAAIGAAVAAGAWEDARRDAHKLRGSAGVHGFAALGAAAGALEDLLRAPDAPGHDALAAVAAHLAEARAEADRAAAGVP